MFPAKYTKVCPTLRPELCLYFIHRCESCRAKLRSYRTLLKHLQTCAKVAKKTLKTEPGAAPEADNTGVPMVSGEMEPSGPLLGQDQHEHMVANPSMLSNSAAFPQQQAPANPISLNLDSSKPILESMSALEQFKGRSVSGQPDAPYSSFPPSLSPVHPVALPDPSQLEQQQQWSPRIGQSSLVSSPPNTPPSSNAVWRKNQGE